MTWAFITGEYPPQRGGVSDYTRLVAAGLARGGEEVHVWAPECASGADQEASGADQKNGVTVHRLPGHYGIRALSQLDSDLKGLPVPRRLLVQYVPHAFGWKAMNVPFCSWLRSRREPVWTMFHEVSYPRRWNQRAAEHVLGAVTHAMAYLTASGSDQIFYSTSAWLPLLDRLARSTAKTWLPVPSNLAESVAASTVDAVRMRFFQDPAGSIIGHFGTYGSTLQDLLFPLFSQLLLADSRRVALFAGRGSGCFRTAFLQRQPSLAARVHCIESECPSTLAAHLAACDVLIQPYPDGVTTRRSTLMAGLALGKAVATNLGPLTESLWQQSAAVALAQDMSPVNVATVVDGLLSDAQKVAEFGARAAELYTIQFALSHTVRTLQTS
jgi:glycosyltransferase involved in cell wall biosynthesis